MLERFLVVLGQVATLFLLMGAGFGLAKGGLLTSKGREEMTSLLLYVVTPCVIIGSFQTPYDPALLRSLAMGTAGLAVCYVIYALSVRLLFRREEENDRVPLRFGSMYANIGFMGIPLVRAVLGEEAVIYAVVSLVAFNVAVWTHGAAMMGGGSSLSAKKILLNPGVIGVAVGLPLFLAGVSLPGPLGSAVGFLADLNTPLAMVVIGAQMAEAKMGTTFRSPRLYAASAVKLLVMPLLTAVVLLPLRRDPLLYTVLVILSAAPTAGTTAMFSQRFGRDERTGAQLVTLCTFLSAFTLPVTAVLAQALAG